MGRVVSWLFGAFDLIRDLIDHFLQLLSSCFVQSGCLQLLDVLESAKLRELVFVIKMLFQWFELIFL